MRSTENPYSSTGIRAMGLDLKTKHIQVAKYSKPITALK